MRVLTVEQMKKAEAKAVEQGISYLELMENAGTMSAFNIVRTYDVYNKRFVILCGSGNNGGDGFVIARRLSEKGAKVSVILVKSIPNTQTSYDMFAKIQDLDIEIVPAYEDMEFTLFKINQAECIVDCIFGTGFVGEVVANAREIIEKANDSLGKRIAIDIPSGINANTGEGEVYFKADITYALGAYKKAHVLESNNKCGEVKVLNIGISDEIYEEVLAEPIIVTGDIVKETLKPREQFSHKGDYGKLLNIVGSVGMGGAAIMATKSALRCGAGLVTLATPKEIILSGFTQVLEAVSMPLDVTEDGFISLSNQEKLQERIENSTACLIGCGLGRDKETQTLVKTLLTTSKKPIILDADGINAIADDINILKTVKCNVIITPHTGEMSRLTGFSIDEIEKNRKKMAYQFAKEYNLTVVLKGHETLIATPKGIVYKNQTGNAGMAKGGSGDVLAGMIASFVAQGIEVNKASVLGVYLHGLAGDRCAEKYSQYAMLPTDIITQLPLLLAELLK